MTGVARWLLNSSLGGVKRVTLGAAWAVALAPSKAATSRGNG